VVAGNKFVALSHREDPDRVLLYAWGLALILATFTLLSGLFTSREGHQLAWFGGWFAAGLVGCLGLAVTLLMVAIPTARLGGLRLDTLLSVAPFLPAGVGLVGLAYACFLRDPTAPQGDTAA
jgi:hypothetical protein